MSYQIHYETEKSRMYPMKTVRISRKRIITYVGIGILIIALLSIRESRGFFIPGDPEETREAFSQLIDDLRSGDTLGDAVMTFCKEIIPDGE